MYDMNVEQVSVRLKKVCICMTCRTGPRTAEKCMHMHGMNVAQDSLRLKKLCMCMTCRTGRRTAEKRYAYV